MTELNFMNQVMQKSTLYKRTCTYVALTQLSKFYTIYEAYRKASRSLDPRNYHSFQCTTLKEIWGYMQTAQTPIRLSKFYSIYQAYCKASRSLDPRNYHSFQCTIKEIGGYMQTAQTPIRLLNKHTHTAF